MEFYSCHKTDNKIFKTFSIFSFVTTVKLLKEFIRFWGRCLNIRDVCMDFEPCFKVFNLISAHPEDMKLGQMTNFNVIFLCGGVSLSIG